MKKLFLGLSGYQYADWKGKFYPPYLPKTKWLSYYADHFRTLEVNGSFYTSLRKTTYEKWFEATPPDFSFAVKGHRYITQLKKLHDVDDAVDKFFQSVCGLTEKLSVVLWQFPASFRFDRDNKADNLYRLEHFLSILPGTVRQAFEFRHDSCWDKDVIALLQKANAASVIADSSVFPRVEVLCADFIYIRFHGPKKLYMSSYSDEELGEYARSITKYLEYYDVYCYFNNDGSGYAIENARKLEELLVK